MLAVERRNLILEKLQEEKRVVVSELSQLYDVSEETIRRDLDKLDKDGFATKSYGGAVLNENTNIEMPFNVRKKQNVAGKQRIAELIANEIIDGDSIMLDASSTAIFIAKAIRDRKDMTVITNSLEIAIELSDVPDWNIIVSGGQVKEGYLALLGPKAVESISTFNVDKTIISCKGLDERRGITDSNEYIAQVKQVMMNSAKESILAVDSTKFNTFAFSKVGTINDINMVVTDKKPEDRWLHVFEENGVKCLYPDE